MKKKEKNTRTTTTTTLGCFRISAARHYEAFSKVSTSRTKDSLTPSPGCFIYSLRSGSAKRRKRKKKKLLPVSWRKEKKERKKERKKKEECASPDGIDSSAVKVSRRGGSAAPCFSYCLAELASIWKESKSGSGITFLTIIHELCSASV